MGIQFHGALKQTALENALEEIVRRHPALRAKFEPSQLLAAPERDACLRAVMRGTLRPGMYTQRVLEFAPLKLRVFDLGGQQEEAQNRELERICIEEQSVAFELGEVPLMRATVLRLAEQRHLLILAIDHLAADGWSLQILQREITALYHHFAEGTPDLPGPRLGYPEFAAWQAEAMSNGHFERDIDFWGKQWAVYGASRTGLTDLPFAHRSPKRAETSFASSSVTLDEAAACSIRDLARVQKVTLNVIFTAATAALLANDTRKSRVAIWSHFSNRVRPGTEDAIGYFINSHILGFDFAANPTGAELMQSTKQTLLDAYEHQELPLASLWQQLRCYPRHAGARVLVDFLPTSGTETKSRGDMHISRASLPLPTPVRFSALGIYVRSGKEIKISSEFSAEHFPSSAVGDFLNRLRDLVLRLASAPHEPVLPRVNPAEFLNAAPLDEMSEFVVLGSDLLPGGRTTGTQSL